MAGNNVNDWWALVMKSSEDVLRGVARAIGWAPPAPGPPSPSPSPTPLTMQRTASRNVYIRGDPDAPSARVEAYGELVLDHGAVPMDQLGPPDPRNFPIVPPAPPPVPTTREIANSALSIASQSSRVQDELAKGDCVKFLRASAASDAAEAVKVAGQDPTKGKALAERALASTREADYLEAELTGGYGERF